jgi:hypothetical protein
MWWAEALALSLLVFARCRIWLECDPVGAGIIPGIGAGVPGAGVSGAVPAGAPVIVFCAKAEPARPIERAAATTRLLIIGMSLLKRHNIFS